MNDTLKITIISLLILTGLLLLQTTLLKYIAIGGTVRPDLFLIFHVFIALRQGKMAGQMIGFSGGLVEDVLNYPPLGFYALIRTILGFIVGSFQGAFNTDSIIFPSIIVLIVCILKGVFIWIISLIFSINLTLMDYFGWNFWIHVAYTALLAPIFFAILSKIKVFRQKKEVLP